MTASPIKLISWNVNGLRAALKKGFVESILSLDADIVAIQETKLQAHQLTDEMTRIDHYTACWSHATVKKGYSGVGVYTRLTPESVREGFGRPEYDNEGRVLRLDFPDFTFFNVYFPNGQMNDERLEYKLDFYRDFFDHADGARKSGRPVVISGDFNTAHNEIDLKNPKSNEKRSGFLRVERDVLDRLVENGYVDTFRHFYPETVKYSWWSYRASARQKNVGWRIDYFFVSRDLIESGRVRSAFIDNDVYGSDHCPVGLELGRG